ncbi:zinc carboxypeptidase [Drechmeria coniospora]|uniref:Inactive metallocarboxypeptidase ECM14 n=1 Tax=Drechmeria coniospora TaxID=98403 RepID=A0A151GRF0_DRECN|nr:zinc carboxypeptidase [Drechmeria coniospora]KYK59679.1 zinc carboxypeptidase [Drechmeria coniospora]
MKLKSARTVASTGLLLLLLRSANAAGIGPADGSLSRNNADVRLFPFLANVRDAAVELFFGRHPAKARHRTGLRTPDGHRTRAKYTNELVLRFNITGSKEGAAILEAAARLFLDIWVSTTDYVDVRLHADEVAPLLGLLPESLRSSHATLVSDLATAVYQASPLHHGHDSMGPRDAPLELPMPLRAGDNRFFEDYQPLTVIVRWMRLLEAMFPAHVKYMTVGTSFEGREISALRVGVPARSGGNDEPRRTIVVTGGLHAREWISTSTVNYLAWSMITSFGKDRMITKLLTKFDFVFVPAVNPDGVEYTWQVDRLWRKSRQQTIVRFCEGLDLDRSFGYGWEGSQAQNDPCSQSYPGEQSFQAVEAMQLANWARNETLNKVKFVGLWDLHSYSQQILFPYSSSCEAEPPNLENLEEVAAGIAKAIRISNGESYSVASACEGATHVPETRRKTGIQSGGGSAIDWFYHEMQAHFSYQIKLRDTGSFGFLLPRESIIPTGEEMFSAMKYFGDYLLGNNGIEKFSAKAAVADTTDLGLGKGSEIEVKNQELR